MDPGVSLPLRLRRTQGHRDQGVADSDAPPHPGRMSYLGRLTRPASDTSPRAPLRLAPDGVLAPSLTGIYGILLQVERGPELGARPVSLLGAGGGQRRFSPASVRRRGVMRAEEPGGRASWRRRQTTPRSATEDESHR